MRHPLARAVAGTLIVASTLALSEPSARADDAPLTNDALFTQANQALNDGKPAIAIADFESLADRGLVDPVASFDRGIAYAERARVAEVPGDLGRATQGFEEARELTRDKSLAADATHALTIVRSEIARRRTRSGETMALDAGTSFTRAIVRIAPEDGWALLAVTMSLILGLGLFLRRFTAAPRVRVGGAIAGSVSAPLTILFAVLGVLAREDRLHGRDAIIVGTNTRLANERHIAIGGASPLPEGARVEVLDSDLGWTHARFGSDVGWVPSSALRSIARFP